MQFPPPLTLTLTFTLLFARQAVAAPQGSQGSQGSLEETPSGSDRTPQGTLDDTPRGTLDGTPRGSDRTPSATSRAPPKGTGRPPKGTDDSTECPEVHIIGAREAGAKAGYGAASGLVEELLQGISNTTTDKPLDYPACSEEIETCTGLTYADSALQGTTEVATVVNAFNKKCPDTSFVLVGYSQGGQIMDNALCGGGDEFIGLTDTSALFSEAAIGQVAAAIFMGSPRYRYEEGVESLAGTCRDQGVAPRPAGFKCSAAPVIKSYCDAADPTCCNGKDQTVHGKYGEVYGAEALQFVKSMLGPPQGPAVQDPTAQDPTAQDPTAQDPTAQDPTAQDPTAQDPTAQDPTAQDPTAQDPTAQDPTAQDPTAQDPTAQDPVVEEPATKEPATKEPATKEPATKEPATKEPATKEPATKEPATEEPATEEPATEEPATKEPATEEPAIEELAAEEPTAQDPTAQDPTAQDPVVEEPATKEPAAEEPAAEEPATEASH